MFQKSQLLFIMMFIILMLSTAIANGLNDVLGGFDDTPTTEEQTQTDGLDDIFTGFDDGNVEQTVEDSEIVRPKFYTLNGFAKLGTTFNIHNHEPQSDTEDWQGLSRLRAELQLELSLTIPNKWKGFISGKGSYDAAFAINNRDQYTDNVLDAYESELELRDTYLQGSLTDDLDIKIGRQIVPWGKSDNIRITDILNPLDVREPGLTDIEDVRLPITMTKIDYYIGQWNISAIIIHEIRFNKLPEYGHDFYPSNMPLPDEDTPNSNLSHTEYALALNGNFSGWDISFYAADVYDDNTHAVPAFPPYLEHARINMFGSAVNIALGSWLIKGEMAYLNGLQYFNHNDDDFSRTDALIGFEYSGFTNTTISLELANRHINDYTNDLDRAPDFVEKDDFQSAIRITRTFMHEKLDVTFLALTFGTACQNGAMQRLSADYELSEALTLTGGAVLYTSGGESLYKHIEKNDRIFAEMKYSF